MVHKKPKNIITQKTIVVTHPEQTSKIFSEKLKKLGFDVFVYPGIKISKPKLSITDKRKIDGIASYDWIIFTSRNGVIHFLDALKELGINQLKLTTIKIAAVGPATALELTKNNVDVHFIPKKFTTRDLSREISGIENKKILLPRASIATKSLTKTLQKRGAAVTEISIYQTKYANEINLEFEKLIKEDKIRAITFTSPSTIRGFMGSVKNQTLRNRVLALPVYSIGPVTTKSAIRFGFSTVQTAKIHTIDGLVSIIRESNL